jgi:hypothetical protein
VFKLVRGSSIVLTGDIPAVNNVNFGCCAISWIAEFTSRPISSCQVEEGPYSILSTAIVHTMTQMSPTNRVYSITMLLISYKHWIRDVCRQMYSTLETSLRPAPAASNLANARSTMSGMSSSCSEWTTMKGQHPHRTKGGSFRFHQG